MFAIDGGIPSAVCMPVRDGTLSQHSTITGLTYLCGLLVLYVFVSVRDLVLPARSSRDASS